MFTAVPFAAGLAKCTSTVLRSGAAVNIREFFEHDCRTSNFSPQTPWMIYSTSRSGGSFTTTCATVLAIRLRCHRLDAAAAEPSMTNAATTAVHFHRGRLAPMAALVIGNSVESLCDWSSPGTYLPTTSVNRPPGTSRRLRSDGAPVAFATIPRERTPCGQTPAASGHRRCPRNPARRQRRHGRRSRWFTGGRCFGVRFKIRRRLPAI